MKRITLVYDIDENRNKLEVLFIIRSDEYLLEYTETSPHFIINIFVSGDEIENMVAIFVVTRFEALKE